MAKFLKILALTVATLLVLLFVGVMLLFSGQQRIGQGPPLPPGVTAIKDGMVTAFALDAGAKGVVLIDAGNDVHGENILSALQLLGKKPEDVTAIFITHAHRDHIAAIPVFRNAEIYSMAAEVPYASGTEAYQGSLLKLMGARNKTPIQVSHPLQDGQTVHIGDLEVTAYALPGHTVGSGAYLARGVLFVGDAAMANTKGEMMPPVGPFSDDQAQGIQSLKNLANRRPGFLVIATAHNGNLGRDALIHFSEK